MFNFVYYRLYKMYKEKEGETNGFSATLALSLIQFCIIFSVMLMLDWTFSRFWHDWLNKMGEIRGKIGVIFLGVILFLFNYFYYKKNRDKVITKYENHPANKWFKPWMLYVFVIIILFVIPFLCWQLLALIR